MSDTEREPEPVKYTVLEKSLIGNEIFEEGSTCLYAGLPAENLAPQCEVGAARYQEYLDTNAERVRKMKIDNAEAAGGLGDPKVFAAALSAAITEANQGQAALIADAVAAALAKVFPNGTGKKAVEPASAEAAQIA